MRLIIIALILGLFGPDDKKEGRKGNALMRQDLFEEAAAAYRQGLAGFNTAEPDAVHSGLINNLGAALFRQGDFEGALNAFDGAVALATSSDAAAASVYNSGGAAFRAEALEESLARYRQALLQNPGNEDARFNYEFVKRRLEEQQQNQDQQQQNQDQNQDQQDENQDQQDQNQDQQDENQDQQDQQQDQNQQQDQQQQPQNPEELSQEEAQRILEALENEEQQLLRQVQKMKTRPRRVEKDW
ncbi:MAG: tetratricopeptide repeat protein [Rhodothermales bacterium]|nr:tetratricopeptide repeat protein [Rhodothermales bacterium]